MKTQLACKLHRLPQPSTRHSLGQFACWPTRQPDATGPLGTAHIGSSLPGQPVPPDTPAA